MDIKEFKKTISNVSIVSFDIFDTLLLRDFYEPIDVFKYIEDNHNLVDFQKKRIIAEIKSRAKNSTKEEITYQDIYLGLDDLDANLELLLEHKCCSVNPEAKAYYDEALKQGKKIIAISDMYLEEDIVQKLLKKCGYDKVDQIFMSSTHGKTKEKGSLYKYVLDILQVPPAKILHIGDNYKSDYISAQDYGLEVIYLPAKRDLLAKEKCKTVLENIKNHNSVQGSLYAGLIAKQYEVASKCTYWNRFGFEYTGIVVYQFVEWVYEYCLKHTINRVYFMARDGEIMKKAFDLLYADSNIKSYYLEASRRTFFFASMRELNDDVLEYFIAGALGTTIRMFIRQMQLEGLENRAEDYFDDMGQKIDTSKDRQLLKAFFKKEERFLLKKFEDEQANLRGYLTKKNYFIDAKKAVVDIGWDSSSQKYLEQIVDEEVTGLYFGTKPTTHWHDRVHGFYFNKGVPKRHFQRIMSSLEVSELLFLGTHRSVAYISGKFEPVYYATRDEEKHRIVIATDIHAGALEFIRKYHELLLQYKVKNDKELVDIVIENILEKPSLEDIKHMGAVYYETSSGSGKYEEIIKNPKLTYSNFMINILMLQSYKNDNYWQKGWIQYQYITNSSSAVIVSKLILLMQKLRRCKFHGFELCVKKIISKILAKMS